MAQFQYTALSSTGEKLTGVMEAANKDEVVLKLQEAGNLPIDAKPLDANSKFGAGGSFFQQKAMTDAEVLQFTQQLATLLGAGQPLDRALQILLDLPDSDKARKVISDIRESVRGGTSLANAMEQQHGLFSRLYLNMVRAGEIGGSLDDALTRLADYMERSQKLKSDVVSAMIYPALLLTMVLLAIGLMMVYVIPTFVPLFDDLDVEVPLITQIVLTSSEVAKKIWWMVILGVVAVAFFIGKWLQDPDNRRAFHNRLLKTKYIGALIAKLETARLSRTLGTLLKNGVPLLTAMSIAKKVVGNLAMASAVEEASKDVKTGGGLSVALSQSKLFPRLALQMIAVGEESGELDGMLLKTADVFDNEVKTTIDRLIGLLVPVVVMVMALVVGMVVLAILIPIFDLVNNIG